jgi:biopolymer transport protein ExbD
MAITIQPGGDPDGGPDGGEDEALVDINTTPLIDVMLVLLIMLIVTIPIQTHAVKIDMPGDLPATAAAPPPVVKVDIDAEGVVTWNGQPVSDRAALDALLRAAATAAVQPDLHVRPNRLAAYETVAAVLASAQRQGITRIGIVDTGAAPER